MAKQFKDAAAAARPVYSTIIGSAQQPQETQEVQEEQPALDVQEAQATQGRKGAKMPRINMAFTPSNLDYLRVMAGIKGMSITRYVNALVEKEREENGATYDAAKKLIDGDSL